MLQLHAVGVRLPGGVIASSGAMVRSIVGIAGCWSMGRYTFPSGGWRMKKVVRDNGCLLDVVRGGGWAWLRLVGGVVGVLENRWKKKKGMAMNKCDLFWLRLEAALLVTWLVFVALYMLPLFSL
jgi:hypothetical protein